MGPTRNGNRFRHSSNRHGLVQGKDGLIKVQLGDFDLLKVKATGSKVEDWPEISTTFELVSNGNGLVAVFKLQPSGP